MPWLGPRGFGGSPADGTTDPSTRRAHPNYDAARPNHTEAPNISRQTKDTVVQAAHIERVMRAYEDLMQVLIIEDGPDFGDFGDVGISMAQVRCLHVLAAGRIHMSRLVARLRVTPSTTSGLVEKLVDQGLAARADDPTDRRQVIVSATPAGLELIARFRELNANQLRGVLQTLPDGDLDIVGRSLEILRDATIRRRSAAEHPSDPSHPSTTHDQGSHE